LSVWLPELFAKKPKVALYGLEKDERGTVRVRPVPGADSSLLELDCIIAPLPSVPLVDIPVTSTTDQTQSVCVCPAKSIVIAPVVGLLPIALKTVILFLEDELVS